MNTALVEAGAWAQAEFGFAKLDDARRNKRLVKIASNLAAHPGGTLPQAFPDWAELKAAYRFLGQNAVTFERIVGPHLERTRQNRRQAGEYLLLEDTTLLDYSRHAATEDLGVIGDGAGRGFELHSALAIRVESWNLAQRPEGIAVGLFDQQCHRPRPAPPRGRRAPNARRLAEGAGRLHEALKHASVVGQTTVELRARPGQAARTARVQLRSVRVDLDGPWRPGAWQEPVRDVGVVEITEPASAEVKAPLHWVLLTSLPCDTPAQVQHVSGSYTARWWIEEYHKALKSGATVEASQLATAQRLESLIAVLAVVAVRLLSTKLLARSQPDGPTAALSFGPQMLALLEQKLGPPKEGWTNQNVLIATARLGGFLARKHDGLPGWQTIWRGWQRLIWMLEGVETLNQLQNKCG
jgi:hypothetical protein